MLSNKERWFHHKGDYLSAVMMSRHVAGPPIVDIPIARTLAAKFGRLVSEYMLIQLIRTARFWVNTGGHLLDQTVSTIRSDMSGLSQVVGPAVVLDVNEREHRLTELFDATINSQEFLTEYDKALKEVIDVMQLSKHGDKLLIGGDLEAATGIMRKVVVRACERSLENVSRKAPT
jgi:hypothetical protein